MIKANRAARKYELYISVETRRTLVPLWLVAGDGGAGSLGQHDDPGYPVGCVCLDF